MENKCCLRCFVATTHKNYCQKKGNCPCHQPQQEEKIVINENLLNGVVLQMVNNFETSNKELSCSFKINGKEYFKRIIIQRNDIFTDSEMYNFLKDSYVDILSNLLLKETINLLTNN